MDPLTIAALIAGGLFVASKRVATSADSTAVVGGGGAGPIPTSPLVTAPGAGGTGGGGIINPTVLPPYNSPISPLKNLNPGQLCPAWGCNGPVRVILPGGGDAFTADPSAAASFWTPSPSGTPAPQPVGIQTGNKSGIPPSAVGGAAPVFSVKPWYPA